MARVRTVKPRGFIERSLEALVRALGHAIESEEIAKSDGLLQHLDPRVKLVGFFSLILASVLSRSLVIISAIFAFAILMAMCSRVPLLTLVKRVWLPILIFTTIIGAPALFMTPGQVIYRFPILNLGITAQGARSTLFLLARTETAATLSLLLVLCTYWTHLLKALRALRVPAVVVVVLGMTHRYIFLLLETARETFESRRSRIINSLRGSESRQLAVNTAAVLMDRSLQVADDVYMAMQSRGYDGEVRVMPEFRMKRKDYAVLAFLLSLSAIAVWLGR